METVAAVTDGVSVTLSTGSAFEVTRTSATVGATIGIGVAVSTLLVSTDGVTVLTSRVRPVLRGKKGTVLTVSRIVLMELQQREQRADGQ